MAHPAIARSAAVLGPGSLATRAATTLDLKLPAMIQPDLHPDGRRLLFRAGEVTDEIWPIVLVPVIASAPLAHAS